MAIPARHLRPTLRVRAHAGKLHWAGVVAGGAVGGGEGRHTRAGGAEAWGPREPLPEADGVAGIFLLNGTTRLGFITPISDPFCGGCERLRLGPDGRLKICLFDQGGIDLRKALREEKAGPLEIEVLLKTALKTKMTWERGKLGSLSSHMFRIGG